MSGIPMAHYLRVYGSSPAFRLRELIQHLPSLEYSVRKKLMTVARARQFPQKGTSLYNQTYDTIHGFISSSPDVNEQVKFALSTPMLSGFLLSALLAAPYEVEDIRRIKEELMWKEVSVMESIPRTPAIEWENIYNVFCPMHVDWKLAPKISRILQRCLRLWTDKCQRTVLYPSMGKKSVSFQTVENFEGSLGVSLEGEEVTTSDLEHYYSRSGIKILGGCEMRQRWYPTQASPRTYYAQGGSAYHTSKHLRDAFNWLCDTFRPTNRHDRVSPTGIAVDFDEDVYIYDLTSFTSLFHEHRSFLIFLSRITQDVRVIIFDSFEGPLERSLGDLIEEYLVHNVLQPSYETKIPILADLELAHSVAGFLGVFGNLATCTFPHGIGLSTIRDSDQDNWCAGDDAGTVDSIESDGMDVSRVSRSLGTIAIEKVFRVSEIGAVALKRPVSISGSVLYLHPNILWPIFSVMCDADPRFNLLPVDSVVDRVTGAIVSFLQSCTKCPMSSGDIEFAYSFFEYFYQRNSLPLSGWYPPLTGFTPWKTSIPRMERSIFGQDPLAVLVNSFYGTEYVAALEEDIPYTEEVVMTKGSTFQCNQHKHLTYLEKLGYVVKQVVEVLLFDESGRVRAMKDAMGGSARLRVYEYSVVENLPEHLMILSQHD